MSRRKWVLWDPDRKRYYREWTDIGPRETKKPEEAKRFASKAASLRSRAVGYALTSFEPLPWAEALKEIKLTGPQEKVLLRVLRYDVHGALWTISVARLPTRSLGKKGLVRWEARAGHTRAGHTRAQLTASGRARAIHLALASPVHAQVYARAYCPVCGSMVEVLVPVPPRWPRTATCGECFTTFRLAQPKDS